MWRRRLLTVLAGAALVTGCGGAGGSKGPTAEVTSPSTARPTTTVAQTPEQQVEAAYLRSWDVYAKAVRDLDPSGLEESYAGEQLQRTTAAVLDYQRRNVAVNVQVEHDYKIDVVRADLAVVRDRYRNHSVLVDPDSGEPKEADPNDVYVETYTLKDVGGRWLVTDIARA